MSTYYDLVCVDCNDRLGVECYDRDELARLRSKRETIAQLSALAPAVDDVLYVEHSYLGRIDLKFFAQHLTHNVRIIDGYGMYLGDCREYVQCDCCGHRMHCRLPHAHEGDHSPTPPK